MRILQFIALVLSAVALAPAGAHLFALPNKIHLGQNAYFIVRNIYRGRALFGIVLFANLIVATALAVKMSEQHGPFALVLTSLTCQVAALAIFFVFVYPGNVRPTTGPLPANWQQLRWRWEIGHAIVGLAGFCALTLSALTTRRPAM
jgi:hypothetical protein